MLCIIMSISINSRIRFSSFSFMSARIFFHSKTIKRKTQKPRNKNRQIGELKVQHACLPY